MKCEIIDGQLVVQPTTATEKWAFEQWREGVPEWRSLHDYVIIAPAGELVVQNNPPKPEQQPASDTFLDGLLDSAV